MQLNALQSGGCSDESGQLRRSSRTARTAVEPRHARKFFADTQQPRKSRRARPGATGMCTGRSSATRCVDALCRYPTNAEKPPGMARRYRNAHRNAVAPRHAWMRFADTQQPRKSRRARPGATGMCTGRSSATRCVDALCRYPTNAEKPPGTARRYRHAYRSAVERRHSPPLDSPPKTSGHLSAA